jgi:hypothetical protein
MTLTISSTAGVFCDTEEDVLTSAGEIVRLWQIRRQRADRRVVGVDLARQVAKEGYRDTRGQLQMDERQRKEHMEGMCSSVSS